MKLDSTEVVYILNHEKCGKCNNICYSGVGTSPFYCLNGEQLPKYMNRNSMVNCSNFSKRTRTSVIVPLNIDIKELETFFKVSKR